MTGPARRALRCTPIAGGRVRSAGPLTDRDREVVAEFVDRLHAQWLAEHPDEIEPGTDEPG